MGNSSTPQSPASASDVLRLSLKGVYWKDRIDGMFHQCWWNPQPFGDIVWSHCWEGAEIRASTGNRMGVGDKGLQLKSSEVRRRLTSARLQDRALTSDCRRKQT